MNCFGPSMPAAPVAGTPCQYLIPPPPCSDADTALISVQVDGTAIPEDLTHVNGWDFVWDDAGDRRTAVEIYGPTCDALQNGSATSVVIVFRIILM